MSLFRTKVSCQNYWEVVGFFYLFNLLPVEDYLNLNCEHGNAGLTLVVEQHVSQPITGCPLPTCWLNVLHSSLVTQFILSKKLLADSRCHHRSLQRVSLWHWMIFFIPAKSIFISCSTVFYSVIWYSLTFWLEGHLFIFTGPVWRQGKRDR